MQSIQFRLSVWLAAAILTAAVAAGIFSFHAAFNEAIEIQDNQLRQVASLVKRRVLPAPQVLPLERVPDTDLDTQLIVQRILPPGSTEPAEAQRLALPTYLEDGIRNIVLQGLEWRLFVRTLEDGSRIVIGQQTAERDEIAHETAVRTLMPFMVLIPILLLLVGNLIRELFLPVRQLASELDARNENDLAPIDLTNLPTEVLPFIVAINRLLLRVVTSIAVQRRFIADAAHELRSPMTALSLQTERLMQVDMPGALKERVLTLDSGVKRTRALLLQLLAMAHAQEGQVQEVATIDVWPVLREIMEELMPLAELRQVDIGVLRSDRILVGMPEMDMKMMLRNLVENAIRYAPSGGTVNLSASNQHGRRQVVIEDNGPGIPPDQRERVFDPFYRMPDTAVEGSGLGLAIVKAIAERTGATVTLSDRLDPPGSPGLCVIVGFASAR